MSNYSTMSYNPPEIEGMNDEDVFELAERIVSALSDIEVEYGFMKEFHTRLSDNMYMNAHMDDLISDTVDALDAYDGWRSDSKIKRVILDNLLFRGAEYIANRYGNHLEREFNDRELDVIYDVLDAAPRKHVSARRVNPYQPRRGHDYEPQRQQHSLGSGRNLYTRDHGDGRRRNGGYDDRQPIYQTGGQNVRSNRTVRRDVYGREIPQNSSNRGGYNDELYARATHYRDGRVDISGISRGQQRYRQNIVRPSERGQPRRGIEMDGLWGPVYNGDREVTSRDYVNVNDVDAKQQTRKSTTIYDLAPFADDFNKPKRKEEPVSKPKHQAKPKPKGEKPMNYKGISLIHQCSRIARKYVSRRGGLLVPPVGYEVFYSDDGSEVYNIPQGEINLDKSLHRTEQFFKDWMGDDSGRDPEQTRQALDALQKRKIVSVLEEQLSAKYAVDNDEHKLNAELFSSMVYVSDHGVVSSVHTSATVAEASDVLGSVVKEGSVLDGKPFDYMCLNYLSRSISDWLISADDKSARAVFGEMSMHTKITDIKDMILNAHNHLPANIVVELNDRATKWLNHMLHRYWNCAVDCVDSFVGDIDELVANLDRLGISKESFEAVYRRNKDNLFNLVTLDEATLEKYGLEYEVGSQVLMDYIDVTKLPIASRELDLVIDKSGRGVVTEKVNPDLYKALDAIINKTSLDIVDSIRPKEYVIITNDNRKMYVTKISRDSIVISRY